MAAVIFEGDGILILGQEQDLMGSGFSEAESFMGYLSSVAMWDYVLQVTEIWNLTMMCGVSSRAGNVFMWTDFLAGIHGDLRVWWPFMWSLLFDFILILSQYNT
jgi:CUB/sushi domain-containing protein